MTKAERIAVARTLSCTRCGAESLASCRNQGGNNFRGRRSLKTPRKPMKGVHEERIEAADRLIAKTEEEGHDS